MRNLASIQTIKNLEPIENSDFLEKATILGWGVVVKKDQFKIGDKCVFFEIDSLLPDEPRYEFLKKSSWSVQREKIRLKTVKLRGTLSQGLAMPISEFPEVTGEIGDDITELLNVEKYEPIVPAQLAGEMNSFNWPITKTDETRIQSNPEGYLNSIQGKPYYISIKLDGTSGSFILNDEDYHVCSRNYSLKEKEENTYWKISNKYNIKDILEMYKEKTGINLAVQGEIVGPGIQANKLGLKEVDLFVFNVVDVKNNKRLSFDECKEFCFLNQLNFVPILEQGESFTRNTLNEMLELAKGKYVEYFPDASSKQDVEGIVIRSKDQEISFKVINNDFLLKGGD
jgi:RNA ligase (TIGR02306 family)